MVNISSSIAFVVALVIFGLGGSCVAYLAVKHGIEQKQREQEPFFQLPLYKKLFFLGKFKEKSLKIITILSFCINFLLLILFGVTLWNIIDVNIITSYIIRFGGVAFLILVLVRQFVLYKKI